MTGFRQRKFVVIGAGVAALVASGIAYATIAESTGVYTACKLNATGTIRLINPSLGSSSLLGHCTSLETQISWNQQGQPGAAGAAGPSGKDGTTGKDGSSVTSAALASGDTNCPAGGSQFTSISGASYACNGAKGDTGATGPAGSGGETFKSFEMSPNGTPVTVLNDPAIGQVDAKCTLSTATASLLYTNTSSASHSVGLDGGGTSIVHQSVAPGGTKLVPSGRTPIGWDVTTNPGANEPVVVIDSFDRVLPSNDCVFIVGVELGN